MEMRNFKTISYTEAQYQKAKNKAPEIIFFYNNLGLFCLLIPVIIGCKLYYLLELHWFCFFLIG